MGSPVIFNGAFSKLLKKALRLGTLASAPASPAAGDVYFDSTDVALKVHDGSSFKAPIINPMTTAGDLIRGGTSGAPTRLAGGAAGQYLKSVGATSAPVWSDSNAIYTVENLGWTAAPSGSTLVVTLTAADGSALSSTNQGKITVRSAAQTTTTLTTYAISAAATVTVPNGATLGLSNSHAQNLWIYAYLDSGNAIVPGIGATQFNEEDIRSAILIDTTADSSGSVYATAAQTNRPFRIIGKMNVTMGTAGDWSTCTRNNSHVGLFADEVICVEATGSATALTSGVTTDIAWTTITRDTHEIFDGTTVTVNKTGWWESTASIRYTGTFTLGQISFLINRMNAVDYNTIHESAGAIGNIGMTNTKLKYLTAGQTVKIQANSTGTTPAISSASYVNFSLKYVGREI